MSAPTKTFGQRVSTDAADPYQNQWRMRVGDRVYGPYSGYQMRAFHAQGRLGPQSNISRIEGATLDVAWHAAAADSVLGGLFKQGTLAASAFGQRAEPGASKFVIVAEVKGRSLAPLEAALTSLGRACRVASNVWLLSGAHTVSGLRNNLSEHLGSSDWLFIVDCMHARTAGFNMGPENDAHIRFVWRDDEA